MRVRRVRQTALWFGILAIAVGILGFVPGITNNQHFLNLFQVGVADNIVYIVTGVVGLAMATSDAAARTYFKIVAVVYAFLAIVGLIIAGDGQVLGFMNNNWWDVAAYAVIALLSAYEGWSAYEASDRVGAGRPAMSFGEYQRDHRDRR